MQRLRQKAGFRFSTNSEMFEDWLIPKDRNFKETDTKASHTV